MTSTAAAQIPRIPQQATTGALRNKDIVEMLKAGLTQAIVIAKIKASSCEFDTSPAALKELKVANVSDAVILAMVQAPPARHRSQQEDSAQPTVDQILNKYVQARGGKAAIEKPTSFVSRGSLEFQGKSGTVEEYAKAPNKWASVTEMPGFGRIRYGFDGALGWYENPQTGVREMSGQELGVVMRGAQFYQALRLRELYTKMTLKGEQEVGERPVYLIEADPGDGTLRWMYFDTETGLLVRNDIECDTPQGRARFNWYFEDYREMDGVKLPFTQLQSNTNGSWTIKITEVRHDAPIDDAKFAKPSTLPEYPEYYQLSMELTC